MRFIDDGRLHGVPCGLLVDGRWIVDGKCEMWPIAQRTHRWLDLERGNLIPQKFYLASGDMVGPDVDGKCHRLTLWAEQSIAKRGPIDSIKVALPRGIEPLFQP